MVDVSNSSARTKTDDDPATADWDTWFDGQVMPDGQALRQAIETLFFAYRDSTSDPDQVLSTVGYGRAHHRVLHFVGRNPGITVQDLLKILNITKQSLARVLGAMVRDGYIAQTPGERDRRLRHLSLTDSGKQLEAACSRPQQERVTRAFQRAGPEAVDGYRRVLSELINADSRDAVLAMIRK
ncbi:MAG: MarR family transcriptional regulator [Minwuia sp.]|nr:MarR family transcriptional regulator [Minwuia sp.]